MKKIGLIYVIVVAIFATSCNDELVEQQIPAADGSGIIFGGRAGFEGNDPDSRTVYTGQTYTHDNKTFERIDWVIGDKIEIYSTDASNGPSAHYGITSITTGDEGAGDTGKGSDYGYLESLAESSLQWNGDGDHTFYAMYPSASMFIAEDSSLPTVAQGIKLDESGDGKVVVKGTVPSSQPGTITESDGNFTVKPDMKYAYMVAKSTANRADGLVKLSFVPIVTAVEVEMVVPTNANEDVHDVTMAEIQVTGTGIAGDFTADLTSWESGYPNCTNVGEGQGTIQISTWLNNKPITIQEGKSVKFTVFMRPGADPSNLKVSYSPTGSGYFSKSLQGIAIPAKLKTRITNFKLPATFDEETQITPDASRWMDQLADEVEMKALSIPGTGGTFSFNYNGDNSDWYKQQNLSLDNQWKVGIRAFEIVSDRPSSGTTSLGSESVKCNKVSMNVTVLDVLKELLSKVKGTATENNGITTYNPTETAVLILTYQPEGNSPNRNGASYATSLKAMLDELDADQKAQIIKYTPTLTLGAARGKIMILCRINQRDETDNGDTSEDTAFELATSTLANTNIVLIDGCGTAKDRWGARGYEVNGKMAWDIAHTNDDERSVDYWMQFDRSGSIFTGGYTYTARDYAKNVTSPVELKFGFSTNDTNITCWYQEWARVVDLAHLGVTSGNYYERSNSVRWYESYSEKLAAATKTFDMAVSGEYPNYIFINSLCGYLVDSKIASSYKIYSEGWSLSDPGGIAGNIKGLADKINVDFYQHVLNSGFEQKTGPTGIVMMDYVSNSQTTDATIEYDGAYYLPGVILSNNFKGNLPTKPEGGSGNSGTGNDEGEEEEG